APHSCGYHPGDVQAIHRGVAAGAKPADERAVLVEALDALVAVDVLSTYVHHTDTIHCADGAYGRQRRDRLIQRDASYQVERRGEDVDLQGTESVVDGDVKASIVSEYEAGRGMGRLGWPRSSLQVGA